MLGDAPFWGEKNLAKKNAQKGTYESKNKEIGTKTKNCFTSKRSFNGGKRTHQR
jgi:hypothetical protein